MLDLRVVAAVVAVAVAAELVEENAICFNGCSGHGSCRDFMCTCDLGYVGDDCSHKLHDSTVPIFGGGHFNVTARNFSRTLARLPLVLVGFSSRSCHRCGAAEAAYARPSL